MERQVFASRRGLLLGLASLAPTGVAVAMGQAACAGDRPAPVTPPLSPPIPAAVHQPEYDVVPCEGAHQAGIVTDAPARTLVVALDVLAADRAALAEMFRRLTERIRFLTQGGAVPTGADARVPPADSGLMGEQVLPDALTITVSVGASLFSDPRFGLSDQRPAKLVRMEKFPNDAIVAAEAHGDLLIQFCANSEQTTIYALRAVLKSAGEFLAPRWRVAGFLQPPQGGKTGETPRNMLGFKDGTANPDRRDAGLMNSVVWVAPNTQGEPAWTEGGSYQVVRIVRNLVEGWDRAPLGEQERIIGRHRLSGAPLGQRDEFDTPDFSHPAMPANAHIRLANPRTADSQKNLILRRGYNYDRGVMRNGQLDMGLLFVCYQADLDAGFRTVQARLNGEPLEEYIKPTGGGYFFALPGFSGPDAFLGASMLGLAPAGHRA